MIMIVKPLHTAINVTNLERSEYFYGEILGLSKIERPMSFPGTWYQVGNYQIHLIVASQLPANEPKHEKWGRNPHIAFSVSDLDAVKQHLLHYNLPIQASASGRPAIFTKDPDGNVIELSQASGD